MESLEIAPIFLIFLMKSPESFIYDWLLYIADFNWLSKTSETFSVGLPQFEITSLPGTFSKRLWILGNKYSLPKFVAFLNSIVKYLSSFSVILSLVLRLTFYYYYLPTLAKFYP